MGRGGGIEWRSSAWNRRGWEVLPVASASVSNLLHRTPLNSIASKKTKELLQFEVTVTTSFYPCQADQSGKKIHHPGPPGPGGTGGGVDNQNGHTALDGSSPPTCLRTGLLAWNQPGLPNTEVGEINRRQEDSRP